MKIKIIQTTLDSIKTAESISDILIKNNISPCVQIISNIKSVYQWKDKIIHSSEILLLIKTIPENVQKCKDTILKHHNYDMPELIVMDGYIIEEDYKAWFIEHSKEI